MPAIGGRQAATWSYRDYSGETKSIRLYTGEITAVSLPDLLTELGAMTTALNAVTLGNLAKTTWGEETIVSNENGATKDAQIESELLVRCQGATTEMPYSFRIPTVDYTAFNYVGDKVILADAAGGGTAATAALIAAIEATFKMPNDESEALEVVGMEVVR